jgi:hypothetical protein
MTIAAFTVSVVGAPYPNKDGSNRLFEIKLCTRGEPVSLRLDPKNKYDEHAVEVLSARDVQIGFVSSEQAPRIGLLLRSGHQLHCLFQEETPWGAAARIGVDEIPTLPPPSKFRPRPQPDGVDPDSSFYPDDIPPDEFYD